MIFIQYIPLVRILYFAKYCRTVPGPTGPIGFVLGGSGPSTRMDPRPTSTMTKRRLQRNQNQAHQGDPSIVNGSYYALYNAIFPGEKLQQTSSKKVIWGSKSQQRLTMAILCRCRLVRHQYSNGNKTLTTDIVSTYERQNNAVGWCIGRSWERQNCIIYCDLCAVAKKDTFLQHTFRLQHANEKTK